MQMPYVHIRGLFMCYELVVCIDVFCENYCQLLSNHFNMNPVNVWKQRGFAHDIQLEHPLGKGEVHGFESHQ